MSDHTPGPWDWQWATDFNGNADGRIFTAWNTQVGIAAPLCVAVSPRYQTKEQWEKDGSVLAAAPDMLASLRSVNKLISEAAMTGFNYKDGDWAERLFHSQQATSAAITKATRKRVSPIAGKPNAQTEK